MVTVPLRVRCVFSESLNRQTLGLDAGGPPGGAVSGRAAAQESSWRAVVRVLRSPLDDLVSTVFPVDCRACEGPLDRADSLPVCVGCVGRVTAGALFGCERCGEAIDLDLDLEDMRFAGLLREGFVCRACRLVPPPFAKAVAFGTYADPLRTLIRLLKFERVRGASDMLGERLAHAVLKLEGLAANELLAIAVPLYPARERERGYNQSVLLAASAMRWLRRERPQWRLTAAHHALRRVKRTESQYALSPRGRRDNLRGAFVVAGDVRGREVLLIDDILTSGATARECAKVLLAAGAAKVWVATVARAQKRLVESQHERPQELVARWDLNTQSLNAGSLNADSLNADSLKKAQGTTV